MKVLANDYSFSPSGNYHQIEPGSLNTYNEYVRTWDIVPPPEIFGLHDNADITCAVVRYRVKRSINMRFVFLGIWRCGHMFYCWQHEYEMRTKVFGRRTAASICVLDLCMDFMLPIPLVYPFRISTWAYVLDTCHILFCRLAYFSHSSKRHSSSCQGSESN